MPTKAGGIFLKPCGFPRREASRNGGDGMKDYALQLTASKQGYNAKLNTLREYLQAYTLKILQEEGLLQSTAFMGGTALRFLYNLPRFSEDLDFSLERKKTYSWAELLKKVKHELMLAGYKISIAYHDQKTVEKAAVRFEGLMHEAGLSPLPTQKFSVKIEIDTNPPKGAGLKTEIVNKYFPIAFLCHDLASLFAGKLMALLARRYSKGRDFFDLGWYLSRWRDLEPNLTLLQNGLRQISWAAGPLPTESTWRELIYGVVERADWKKVKGDVENFLESPDDLNIFTKENVLQLVK